MSNSAKLNTPKYRIGLVARLTGISQHQLRVWERRYQTVKPARSEGGDRLYSDGDVARLRALKRLSDLGHNIGQIARLDEAELAELMAGHRERSETGETPLVAERVTDQFLDSITRMDIAAAERALSRGAVVFEPRAFVHDVLLPALREVGSRWARGELNVAQEHAASGVLRTQLGALMRLYTPERNARVCVSATPATELHEFGALAAALTAASRGWKVVYLGPNLPHDEIAGAVKAAKAELLMLSLVVNHPNAAEELEQLHVLLPNDCRVIVGGAGSRELQPLPDGFEIFERIEDLDDVL